MRDTIMEDALETAISSLSIGSQRSQLDQNQRPRPTSGAKRSSYLTTSSGLSPAVPGMRSEPDKLRVLIAANCERDISKAEALIVRLSNQPRVETRAVCDHITGRIKQLSISYRNEPLENIHGDEGLGAYYKTAYELCEWADLLVLAPINASTFAKMLHGMTGNLILEILRGWDVTKHIILVPGMSNLMWENPITKKQLNKVRRKWNWIRVLPPILWQHEEHSKLKKPLKWDGFPELLGVIKNQVDLMTLGQDADVGISGTANTREGLATDIVLPPEIWSLIFQHLGDWEIAKALGVYTTLLKPLDWNSRADYDHENEMEVYMRQLEWTILTSPVPVIIEKLAMAPPSLPYLSSLCVKLVLKFCLTDVLTHLELHYKDIFWGSFGSKLLPTKASAVYGRTEILEWWRTSPSFLKKDYSAEAIDGASKSGFLHVLNWWRKSGLPLKYTEAALEQASSKGHILVLEWWKQASIRPGTDHIDFENLNSTPNDHYLARSGSIDLEVAPQIQLKVGKSIVTAAANGQVAVVRWWDTSGIPFQHSEIVAKMASAYGHIPVLQLWKELKGDKFATSFDNQVLVGPTKNGFARVLEWWKEQTVEGDMSEGGERQGPKLRVEYKTCDIEEALEDSVRSQDGEGEAEVRKWWAKNGLNLGLGMSEWMKVKTL